MPDEVERPAVSESVRIVDLIDGLAEFARAFPGWIGADGYPLSWRHYVYGMAHLGRAAARETLRAATAAGAAWMKPDQYRQWRADVQAAAGW